MSSGVVFSPVRHPKHTHAAESIFFYFLCRNRKEVIIKKKLKTENAREGCFPDGEHGSHRNFFTPILIAATGHEYFMRDPAPEPREFFRRYADGGPWPAGVHPRAESIYIYKLRTEQRKIFSHVPKRYVQYDDVWLMRHTGVYEERAISPVFELRVRRSIDGFNR